MSRLIVLTAMTVDGVMTVEEWFVPEGDHMEASLRLFEGDTALLYGRKNYEGLAAYWMAAEGEWADLLNPMPKFVASRTLQEPLTWNATLLKGELEDAVAKLKAERDGHLITNGCGELTRISSRPASSTSSGSRCTRRSGARASGRSGRRRSSG